MRKRHIRYLALLAGLFYLSTGLQAAELRKLGEYDLLWGPYGTTWTSPTGKVVRYLPRYFSTDAFSDNLTLYGKGITGDNTGRLSGFAIGSASYTDTGYFGDIITTGPWVDVRAKGTGVTAVNLAIAALPANGGTVILPVGTTITDPIVMPSYPKKVTLVGMGPNATILQPSGSNQPVIISDTPVTNFGGTGHIIGGFSIQAHAAGSINMAIDMRGMSYTTFHDINYLSNGSGNYADLFYFSDAPRPADSWDGLHSFGACYDNRLINISVVVQSGPTSTVVRLDNTANLQHFEQFHIVSNSISGFSVFYLSQTAQQIYIRNSHFEGLESTPNASVAIYPAYRTIIENCYFESVDHSIYGTGRSVASLSISNSFFQTAPVTDISSVVLTEFNNYHSDTGQVSLRAGGDNTMNFAWNATASVADNTTITHGMGTTPKAVIATPSVDNEVVSVTTLGATTFTVRIKKTDGTTGTTQTIYWIGLK